jgi:HAD superfamily hydrolase (TIGR01490 family)
VARKFAVFDIDGTVIRWQLFHSIVHELGNRQQLSPEAAQSIKQARMTWKRRESEDSFTDYEHTLVHAYLNAIRNLDVEEYNAAIDSVFAEYKDQVYTYTRDLIARLKADNYLLFAISGSQQEIVSKFADYYGFDEAIGAQLEQVDGHFTGKMISPAHHGKQAALDSLLAKYDLDHTGSIAVGDTQGDAVLLAAVERPIAFNPNAGLYQIARDKGWTIVVERKNVAYTLESRDGQYFLA